jgi:hypothetical protein
MSRIVNKRKSEKEKQFSNVKVGSDCCSSGIFFFSAVV